MSRLYRCLRARCLEESALGVFVDDYCALAVVVVLGRPAPLDPFEHEPVERRQRVLVHRLDLYRVPGGRDAAEALETGGGATTVVSSARERRAEAGGEDAVPPRAGVHVLVCLRACT